MAGRVFISHSTRDAAAAERVRQVLEDSGIDCWIAPRDIPIGRHWDIEGVIPGIIECSVMIVLVSDSVNQEFVAEKRTYVVNELLFARRKEKDILPVLIADVDPSDALGFHLATPQAFPLFPMNEERLDALVADIRRRLPGVDAPSHHESVRKLPMRNRNFVGRGDLLAQLDAALAEDAAVVSIIGEPGFGKTQLALEYAHSRADAYEIVCAISAEDRNSAIEDFTALASELGMVRTVSEKAELAAREARNVVRSRFSEAGRWLLVLDNADDPNDFQDMLPDGHGHVLVTTQHRGWLSVGAKQVRIAAMAPEEATRFLLQRTGRDDEPAAAQVANELSGNPLFLEQAAAYLDKSETDFETFLAALRTDFETALDRGTPTNYPRTARVTFELAFGRVAEIVPEAAGVLHLSAFLAADDIPIDTLGLTDRAVADRAVDTLIEYSLVRRSGSDAFSVHRTVQDMAIASLAEEERKRRAAGAAIERVLAAFPQDPEDVLKRAACARLLPHATAALQRAAKLRTDSVSRVRLMDRVSSFHRSAARYEAARAGWESALELLELEGKAEDPLAGTVRCHFGSLLRDLGDLAGALTHHEGALDIHEAVYGPDHADVGTDRAELGRTLNERGDQTGAMSELKRAYEIHQSAFPNGHSLVAEDLASLFTVLARSGNLPGAKDHLERAIATYDSLGLGEHPSARALQYLGDFFAALDNGAASALTREKLEELIAIYEEAYGGDHPDVAELKVVLGDDFLKAADLAGAAANYARALEIDLRAFGEYHWRVGRDRMRSFAVLVAQQEEEPAREQLALSLTSFATSPSVESRSIPIDLANFDEALDRLSVIPAATATFDRILELTRQIAGADSALYASALDHLAEELAEAGELDRAVEEFTSAVDLFEDRLGPQHVRVAGCLNRRGIIRRRRGDLDGAKADYVRAIAIHELAANRDELAVVNNLFGLYGVESILDERASTLSPNTQVERQAPLVLEQIYALASESVGVETLRTFANAQLEGGNVTDALATRRQILQMLEETYGEDHPEVASALNDLGDVQVQLGNLDAALTSFQRARAIHVTQYGPENFTAAQDAIFHLAPALASLGEPEHAERELEEGLAIFELVYAQQPDQVEDMRTDGWLKLGDSAVRQQRVGDAQRLYQSGFEHAREPLSKASFQARLGGIAADGGDAARALDHFRQCVKLCIDGKVTDAYWGIARACAAAIRPQSDRRPIDEALRLLREDPLVEGIATFHGLITGRLPSDWHAKESLTFLAPDGQANVIASNEPLDESIDTKMYAEVQGDLLHKEFPGYHEHAFYETDLLGGRRGYLRHFEWTPPDGVAVTQLQLYYAENERGYTATATTPSTNFPVIEHVLRQILHGLTL